MLRYLHLLLGAALLLTGCSLAPPYTPPAAPVPAAWPSGPAYEGASEISGAPAAAQLPWRAFFTDEGLQRAIEQALRHNRDLRLAALNVQRARALYGIQRAALFPAVDASADYSKQRLSEDFMSSGQNQMAKRYDVNLGVYSWEVDFFGRLRSLKDRALEVFLATEQARRSSQILIVSAVAETYLTLAADRQKLQLAETTLAAQQQAYALIKRRHEVGIASALDLYQAQTILDIARGDMARYTQRMAQDENALNLLTGALTALPREDRPADLIGIKPLATISAGLSSEVLLQRPDVLEAENLLKAAYADIGAARAALFPRITLTTTVGTASSELAGLFASGSGTWLFAPQVTVPIFDARLWSALEVTKADREIALARYEKSIQTAFREVADALAIRGTIDQQLAAQQSLVRAEAETYRLSDLRYTKGVDSYLSVLVAQRTLYAAQQELVTLNLAQRASLVRLYAVLGGGYE